jgi:hypothetical protein
MSIKPEDIQKVVLEEDDFGHEIRVGSILARPAKPRFEGIDSLTPQHGGTYKDPVTTKTRQFD